MNVAGMTQAGLARATSLSQQSINRLVNGGAYSSRYLHQIARALLTSPEYLTGETDDPSPTAPPLPPPPEPEFQVVTMDVMLPSEPALAEMFAGLLAASPGLEGDELALELARLLPKALANARSARPSPRPVRTAGDKAAAEAGRVVQPRRPQSSSI